MAKNNSPFTFHDNNSHHESLTDWMNNNVFLHKTKEHKVNIFDKDCD